jgi:cyclase
MFEKRIIPCLDIKDGKVVKGVNFVDIVDVGDPVEIARRYEEEGADEVVFLDIAATNEGRATNCALFERAAKTLNIPFTVGGGVRSIDEFGAIIGYGAAKVSLNSAAVKNPDLIKQASDKFGKERVVAAIDAKRVAGNMLVFTGGGMDSTGLELAEWAKQCESLGAGEILLTSIDADGTQSGYDIEMTAVVASAVDIPVIASGGCGSIDDIIEVFRRTNCGAALVASLFHFGKASVADVKLEMERNGFLLCKR